MAKSGLTAAALGAIPASAVASLQVPSPATDCPKAGARCLFDGADLTVVIAKTAVADAAQPAPAAALVVRTAPIVGTASVMTLGAPTIAPKGYIAFCVRRPDQCGLPSQMSDKDRADLGQMIYRQAWAQVFSPSPQSLGAAPAATAASNAAGEPMEDYDGFVAAALPDQGDVRQSLAQAVAADAASADVAPIVLTGQVWAKLAEVNRSINSRLKPMTDEQAFGWSDYWTLPLTGEGGKGAGNCKHYVLEKRKALVEAGVPAAALSIAIVRTGWGEVHAVLIVATDKGELVLDNLTPAIRGWRQAPYTWLSRQVPGHPLQWATVAAAG